MTAESQDAPETPPLENGRRVLKLPSGSTVVAFLVATSVVGVWLFVFVKIALGGLSNPETLANSEALIAILALVGGPAGIIIAKVMDKWLGSAN